MMPIKTQAELNTILQSFDAIPGEFILNRTIYAGPDEMLYLMNNANNQKIGIWARDHMEDLAYEADYLKTKQKIQPIEWLKTEDDDRLDIDGISYAIFLYH